MKSYLLSIVGLALAISLSGCEDDDETNPRDAGAQQITAKIDGTAFKSVKEATSSSDFEVIQAELVDAGPPIGFVLYFGGVDVSWDNAAAVDIGLIIIGPDFSSLEVGAVLQSRGTATEPPIRTYAAAGTTQMVLSDGEAGYSALTDDFGEIELVVTAIDRGAKTISGTFSFTAYDPDEDITVVVTEGEFRNISWAD